MLGAPLAPGRVASSRANRANLVGKIGSIGQCHKTPLVALVIDLLTLCGAEHAAEGEQGREEEGTLRRGGPAAMAPPRAESIRGHDRAHRILGWAQLQGPRLFSDRGRRPGPPQGLRLQPLRAVEEAATSFLLCVMPIKEVIAHDG